MSFTNKITRSIFEIFGDISEYGYMFNDIPIRLNKDYTTQYPEIIISPFIDKVDIQYQKNIERSYQKYRHWEAGVFQIDIYAKNIIECQNIYDKLVERVYDFFNLETLIYNDNGEFEEIDTNIYKNYGYGIGDLFKDIYEVVIENKKLQRVYAFEDLEKETYYVDKDALYLYTNRNLRTFKVKVLLQGRLFNNGDAYSDRGLHYYELSKQTNLSDLEHNEVDRISFDMYILYSHKRTREPISKVKKVVYPKTRVR